MIVLLPTYARPALFTRICADLRRELTSRDALVVLDDASPDAYAGDVLAASGLTEHVECTLLRAPENRGRIGYWRTVGALLDAAFELRRPGAELVAYLADDLRLADGWRQRVAEETTRVSRMPGCIGLHAHRDGRTREWGLPGGDDVDGQGEHMAWQDGVWVTRARWLESLRPEEVNRDWVRYPHLGSGAWRSSSYRTHAVGLWWYRPRETMCWHDDEGASVMNPQTTASEGARKRRRVCTVTP